MKKSVFILSGILLLFAVVYFLLIQKEKETFAPATMDNLLALDSAQVDRIRFKRFDTQMIFNKIGQSWFMSEPDSFRADNDAINQLLSATVHLKVGEVISSKPEKQPFFQVDDFTGTTIQFESGENLLASLVVGKTSKDLLHTYLRKSNSNDIYLAPVLLAQMAGRSFEQWKDRGIFAFDPKQITEFEFSRKGEIFRLIQVDTMWQLNLPPRHENSPTETRSVNDYLLALSHIKADEFAKKPEIAQLDFAKSELLLTITFSDSHHERLFVTQMQPGDDRYFAKTDQASNVFVLYDYTFNRLAKKPGDFSSK